MRLALAGAASVAALLASSVTCAAASWPMLPPAPQLQQDRATFLARAEQGIAGAKEHFWDAQAGWYDDFLFYPSPGPGHLARLWSVYPLFESLIAVYEADPSAANLAQLRAMADAAAPLYWNPSLKPFGGYEWYPGLTTTRSTAYFDDSGWLGLAYLDAYTATHDAQDLAYAHNAFRFIVGDGWNAKSGGVWWNTDHGYETAEPLAAAVLIGTRLYEIRHKTWYLQWVKKLLAWADARSFNSARGLYQRNATDGTVLDYVEGLMIVAQRELCTTLRRPALCAKARALADAAAVAFPPDLRWAPQYDVVYLRWMLEYGRESGDARWYALAYHNAQRALASSSGIYGLYTRNWDGLWLADGLEEHAGTVELLAWLAAVPPPGTPAS